MCPKGRFTVQEAQILIPSVIRHIALLAVDCEIALDKYPITSYEVESKIMGIQGYANMLVRCARAIWKTSIPKKS